MKYNLNQVNLHCLEIGLLSPFIFPSTNKWCHVRFLIDPSQLLINSPANKEYLLNITIISLDYFFWWKSSSFSKQLQTLELACSGILRFFLRFSSCWRIAPCFGFRKCLPFSWCSISCSLLWNCFGHFTTVSSY